MLETPRDPAFRCGIGRSGMTGPTAPRPRDTAGRYPETLDQIASRVSANERAIRFGHKGAVIWLTGLSGAGKSTLAAAAERRLFDAGRIGCVLDGDDIRHGLSADLGFSAEHRHENIRRAGEVAALFADAGMICVTAFISPFKADRARARAAAAAHRFLEVYVSADLAVCERRDPKGLYRQARLGKLRDFTGIDSPYEVPEAPDLTIDTTSADVATCIDKLAGFVLAHCRL